MAKYIAENWKNANSLARSGGNYDREAYISEETAKELKWWIKNIFEAFAPIKLPPFDLTIFF